MSSVFNNIYCPNCQSNDVINNGYSVVTADETCLPVYKCLNCLLLFT